MNHQTLHSATGIRILNHNQTIVRQPVPGSNLNHNQTVVPRPGLAFNHNQTMIRR